MANYRPLYISKSKYLDGMRCPKLIWYKYNRKKDVEPPDPQLRVIMEQGQLVGRIAQQMYPGGIRIERDFDPRKTHDRSMAALASGLPVFEAGLVHGSAYAIADILVPAGDGAWDIVEVKSSTSVKGEHYDDAAFQKYTYTGAGLRIARVYIAHIDRDYLRRGEIEPKKLFKLEDVTAQVDERLPVIERELEQLKKAIAGAEPPEVKVGQQCSGCPVSKVCWSFLPAEDHVFILHRGDLQSFELLEQGIVNLHDIPDDFELSPKQAIQRDALINKKKYVDKDGLLRFLADFKYPLYFLDFETIGSAVPIFDLTHPYDDIPFQYSLHVVRSEADRLAGRIEHYSYIAPGDVDPRPEVLRLLKAQLGDSGSIVAYNANYEMLCLKRASEAYPEYLSWDKELEKRFIDLWQPFKEFLYYHPSQGKSTGMKVVLPTFKGTTYDGLTIGEGFTARNEYMRVIFGKGIDPGDRQAVFAALEEYCGQDTMGMVEIWEGLEAACKEKA